jgi:hypothetical protein
LLRFDLTQARLGRSFAGSPLANTMPDCLAHAKGGFSKKKRPGDFSQAF